MKIVGDYHLHTRYSDGRNTVIEMVRAAKEKGLDEIAITEHGFGSWGGGLRKKNFEKWRGEVESARAEMPVLLGIEANAVSGNGRIDIPENMREKFDIILFGIHIRVLYSFAAFWSFFVPNIFYRILHWTPKHRIAKNTEFVKRVIERNNIDIWVHPSRYFKVDVREVAKTCAERGTLIELSSKRISFRPIDFERMQKNGAKFIINSDAHRTGRVGEVTRAEEFLKNCDFDEDNIVNLRYTYSAYKKTGSRERENDTAGRNQKRDTKQKTKPRKK
jgi:putative hydrolase